MKFIDFETEYKTYQDEIDEQIRAVLLYGRYIMGPEIPESAKANMEVLSLHMHPFRILKDKSYIVQTFLGIINE